MAAEHRHEEHVCTSCFKVYQRHDLLLRHRRRCRGLQQRPTRQKACNACVQAKAKCTYSHPCMRCARRGISCVYAVQPSSPHWQQPMPGLQDGRQDTHEAIVDFQDRSLADNLHSTGTAGSGEDLSGFQSSPSLTSIATFARAEDFQNLHLPAQEANSDVVSAGPTMESIALPDSLPIPNLAALGVPGSFLQYTLRDLIQILEQYPQDLLRDDFTTPCVHRSLYDEDIPDMATLARSSAAICCGSAMETAAGARFARHVMDIERQRLIASFPTYSCMQQWDALHAMLVYSILELRALHTVDNDDWKQKSCSKGLKAPFLAKMTRVFIQSHTRAQQEDLTSKLHASVQTFQQWTVSETARRTIFLANIVHFLSNHDPESGAASPYYEPIDDELILNMPLPCTHALWVARTEQEWTLTKEFCQTNLTLAEGDLSSAFNLVPEHLTLKYLLSSFSTDALRNWLTSDPSLGSSDELRSFVILCALKQFRDTQTRPILR